MRHASHGMDFPWIRGRIQVGTGGWRTHRGWLIVAWCTLTGTFLFFAFGLVIIVVVRLVVLCLFLRGLVALRALAFFFTKKKQAVGTLARSLARSFVRLFTRVCVCVCHVSSVVPSFLPSFLLRSRTYLGRTRYER